jgi:hypothetical protein
VAIYYKYGSFQAKSSNAVFDEIYKPGASTAHSGIYRCTGCGKECTSITGRPLPPQNHHQHTDSRVPIRWQLAVWG